MARRQFEKALEKIDSAKQGDLFCKTSYYLGRIYEDMKQYEKAEGLYNELIAINYGYRDTLNRLENIQKLLGRDSISDDMTE